MKSIIRFAALLLLACNAHAALDLNSDQVPDVWALTYNTGAISMTADSDGDGQTNAQEAAAGTNPFSPSSTVKVSNVTIDAYGIHLVFASQAGKRYRVQSATSLNSGGWTDEGSLLPGVGGDMTAVIGTGSSANKFYRVVVTDIDSDNDGVSDWEEIALGFDPNNSHSGGSSGPDDLTAVTAALTVPSIVSVTAIDDLATEPAAGVAASDTASFVVSRTGGLKALTVSYNTNNSGAISGSDYLALSGSVSFGLGVRSVIVTVAPVSDNAVESPETVLCNLLAGANYSIAGQTTAGVIINDRIAAAGTGLRAQFYNETTALNPASASPPGAGPTWATLVTTRIDPVVDYDWVGTVQGTGSPAAGVNVDYFACRWTGEVLPEFSQIYTFSLEQNRCGRLWVNGKLLINKWPGNNDGTDNPSGTFTATIELQGGVRYPIVLEHFETTSDAEMHLRWQSTNQPLQIIPSIRLFADTAPQIYGNLEALLIKGSGVFNYQILASGNPTLYAAANLPPGWTINATTGLLSGNPNTAGEWNIPITASNTNGTGSAIFHLTVLGTGGAITRDVWTGVAGTSVSNIPLDTNPTTSGQITSLDGPQNAADNYGARIRGYVTAPATGLYKFFLTASNAAELYIGNDNETANSFKRAQVTTGVNYQEWANANAGKSPLLYLEAGRQYYLEIRHKAGVGSDHVSVGWLKPGEGGVAPNSATAPSEVVPGYVLSPYVPPAPISGESSLYVTGLSAQGASQTTGYGSATLRLSSDKTQAILSFSYSNLTTPVTAKHIHSDAHGGAIIFDIDDFQPNLDGSYTWDIVPAGAITAADIVNVIETGQSYLNVHTATYPAGEIRGNLKLAAASQVFTPPPAQTWTDPNSAGNVESHLNDNGAARFLNQATFGVSGADSNANGTPDDIENVKSTSFNAWIDAQFALPVTTHFPFVYDNRNTSNSQGSTYTGNLMVNSWWKNSVQAPDQLRQRVAFALSEILVVSEAGPLDDRADALSTYYDLLLQNSFGNFKSLLVATTLHPAMGRYLDMLGNDKPDKSRGRIPNENYAREILQLFSVGLNRLHPDGSLVLNSKGELIPTYDQDAIIGFAHAFTGWYYHSNVVPPAFFPTSFNAASNWTEPMTEVPGRHYTGQKRLLNNVVIPGLPVVTVAGNTVVLDPDATHSTAQIQTPEYQALPALELDATHEAIFQHPNVGPFVCRQLIQRLVTSTPSRGYVYRVVSKFNDNGSGVRGDMKAVIKAILLDYDARSSVAASGQGFGKQREPLVRVTAVARALPPPASIPSTYSQAGGVVTVTTSAPHLFANGNTVYLDFAPTSTTGDAGAPSDGQYAITLIDATHFSINTKSIESATYQQSGGYVRFTTTGDGFAYSVGDTIHVQYLTGTPSIPTNTNDAVEYRSGDELQICIASPNTLRGTYSQTATSGTALTVNINNHGLAVGNTIHLDFVDGNPAPASTVYTVTAVTNTNRFMVAVPAGETNVARNGTIFATPPGSVLATTSGTAELSYPSDYGTRTGTLALTYSDWTMGGTDTELNQTPLTSPTVFNFFLPDYQFPGILANAGLITPEFEITSETSVIRQSNFLRDAIYTDALGQNGLASFRSGGRDIMLDLRPYVNGSNAGLPWAHNNNIDALINLMNLRLAAGQIPASARTIIRTYVQSLPYTNPTPTATQLRNRVRALVHLLITSPDFAIQK